MYTISNSCNRNCSYCYVNHSPMYRNNNIKCHDVILKTIRNINYNSKCNNIALALLGGEVTYLPYWDYILDFVTNELNLSWLEIVSNGNPNYNWNDFLKKVSKLDNTKTKVLVSLSHPKYL